MLLFVSVSSQKARKAALRFCLWKIVQRNYRHVFSAINYFLQLSGKTRSRQRMDLTRGQDGNARLHKCKPGGRKPLIDLPDARSGQLSRLHWVNPKTVRCRVSGSNLILPWSIFAALCPTKVQINTINFYRCPLSIQALPSNIPMQNEIFFCH